MQRTVVLRCDATTSIGVGHVVRCLALADELSGRGHHVVLVGEVSVPWVTQEVERRRVPIVPAPPTPQGMVGVVADLGADAVVLDGYVIEATTGAALRAAGIVVLSVVDDDFGTGQDADLYLDQNLGAEDRTDLPLSHSLLGLSYVLFRDEVLAHRPSSARPARHDGGPLTVLTVFGGTDAHGASPVIAPLVLQTDLPVNLVAVTPDLPRADELRALPLGPGQRLDVRGPDPNLPALATACDLVVTAAGSSVWEFLCLGLPMAVVTVADNQLAGYTGVVDRGLAAPLGDLDTLRAGPEERAAAVSTLAELMTRSAYRDLLSERGRRFIDGRGRARVIDALLTAVAQRGDGVSASRRPDPGPTPGRAEDTRLPPDPSS